jgi:hypothetical protein
LAGVVSCHTDLYFFFVFVCRLVNFHVAVFFSGLLVTAGGMVSVCLADFFNLPPPLMANCTIPLVMCWAGY